METSLDAAETAQAQVIDPAALDVLARLEWRGRPGFMERVIELFLETALASVRELADASASGDVAKLHRASHALKPCSATVGAAVLSAHCEALEAVARTGVVPDAVSRVREIEEDCWRVAAALSARRRQAA